MGFGLVLRMFFVRMPGLLFVMTRFRIAVALGFQPGMNHLAIEYWLYEINAHGSILSNL